MKVGLGIMLMEWEIRKVAIPTDNFKSRDMNGAIISFVINTFLFIKSKLKEIPAGG